VDPARLACGQALYRPAFPQVTAKCEHLTDIIPGRRSPARRGISPIALSACQLLAAALWLALVLAVTGVPAPHFTAASVTGVIILGVLGTGIAYVLNYQIITSEGATIASTVTYLLPVIAIVLGVLVLDETITASAIAGIAFVLPGVALTRRKTRQPAAAEP